MLIEKLFRKDIHSLEENDLNTLIGIPESRSIEFKTIHDIDPTMDHSERKRKAKNDKENILKSVVAFLNSNDPGLLVLGIKTENEIANRISGVKKDVLPQLRSEISLEDFIKEKVKAIPSFLKGYSIEIKIVNVYNDRIIVFIEVLNKNWDRIYYSDITQYVYLREGKSSNSVPLQDTLSLIADRSYPQVYAGFERLRELNREGNIFYPVYKVYFVNKGVKVTEQVFCIVLIGSDEEIDVRPTEWFSLKAEDLDSTKYDLNTFLQSCTFVKYYQSIYPNQRLASRMSIDKIYPFKQYSSPGYLAIAENDIEKIKQIVVITIELNGFVKQEFEVSIEENVPFLKERDNEFNPFITI